MLVDIFKLQLVCTYLVGIFISFYFVLWEAQVGSRVDSKDIEGVGKCARHDGQASTGSFFLHLFHVLLRAHSFHFIR